MILVSLILLVPNGLFDEEKAVASQIETILAALERANKRIDDLETILASSDGVISTNDTDLPSIRVWNFMININSRD